VAYGHRLEVPIRTTAPDVSVIREPVYCLDLYGVAPWAMLDGRMLGRLDPWQSFVAEGGLISYGADPIETFTGAATYADRILKGAQPNELPVELPTTFYLALNLTTAKTLGISFPQSLLSTADEVIE
jgi:ABC transporter substrate binding protein